MAQVTFLRDFRGRASGEEYFTAGTVVERPEWQVQALLAEGVVVVAAPEVPAAPPLVEQPVAVSLPAATGKPVHLGNEMGTAWEMPKPARKPRKKKAE